MHEGLPLRQNVGCLGSEVTSLLLMPRLLVGDPGDKAGRGIKRLSLSLILPTARAFIPQAPLGQAWGLDYAANCPRPNSQGVLVVMLAFTVLELLLAVYASVFWWKQVQPNTSGVSALTRYTILAGSWDFSYDDLGLKSGVDYWLWETCGGKLWKKVI